MVARVRAYDTSYVAYLILIQSLANRHKWILCNPLHHHVLYYSLTLYLENRRNSRRPMC